jgi:hypothetical protein
MSRHKKIEVGAIGPDVDLDTEEMPAADGRRLTEDLAAEIAERALARHRGRPSVSGGSARTPSLTVRVPTQIQAALKSIADAQGRRVSDVSREALEEYVERHAS